MDAGRLDRRITIERLGPSIDNGFTDEGQYLPLITRNAELRPISASERLAAGEDAAFIVRKFRIRRPRSISPQPNAADRLTYRGDRHNILGVTEVGREALDILAVARSDAPATDAEQ